MKKAFLLFSFAVLGIISTGIAQTTSKVEMPQVADTKDGAKIEFESETIDYGTIENNADGNREFKFKNTGNAPLVITTAKGSCGCTVPTWPKEPIKPGDSGDIEVSFDTAGKPNRQNKTITLTTNTESGREVLTLKGSVIPKTN
mgnify:CR=1 FL=1